MKTLQILLGACSVTMQIIILMYASPNINLGNLIPLRVSIASFICGALFVNMIRVYNKYYA